MTKPFEPLLIFGRDKQIEALKAGEYEDVGLSHDDRRLTRFRNLAPIATVFWAQNGGPIRTIIDGRKTRPTGLFPSIKAGFRSMPWDSLLEQQVMQLADISSRVGYLLAQPHRIEIHVRKNRGKPLTYFPDLLLRVHPSVVSELSAGKAFCDIAVVPHASPLSDYELETIIIEVKADVDSRDDDDKYQDKLKFAKEVYSRRGFHFFELRASKHLKPGTLRLARLMDWRKNVTLDIHDERACLDVFGGFSKTQRWRLEHALGGGNLGRVKLNGLHYRGFVSIDLRMGQVDEADVWLRSDGGRA
ncbi:hypothetical protein AMC78_CH02538 [Rhizobium phaseoli]|uniref:hypothetical protein n=1 Tax=Rhizobium phaseoli TaxID=396 RepID=UPI0007EAD3BB|nr:hypothetical protein [Rhizobium phaseoli]ANM04625.1 hypothetical protein AMC78_CH02538 [Rhizobium phaseoli]